MLSSNICYNLVTIIKNDIKLSWNINVIYSFLQLKDIDLLFGTILLTLILFLFILKCDKDIKLKLSKSKDLPEEDGSYEYGSSRWATKREINKKLKDWKKKIYI